MTEELLVGGFTIVAFFFATILLVVYPMLITVISAMLKIIFTRQKKKPLFKNVLLNTPFVKSVIFFKKINRPEPEMSGLYESKALEVLTESVPQTVLQLVIILKFGFASISQIIGLCFSIASLSVFAIQEMAGVVTFKTWMDYHPFLFTPLLILPILMTVTLEITEITDHMNTSDYMSYMGVFYLVTVLILPMIIQAVTLMRNHSEDIAAISKSYFKCFFLPMISSKDIVRIFATLVHIVILTVFLLDKETVGDTLAVCYTPFQYYVSILHCGQLSNANYEGFNFTWLPRSSYVTCTTHVNEDYNYLQFCIMDECKTGLLSICDTVFGSDHTCKERLAVCPEGAGSEDLFDNVVCILILSLAMSYAISRIVHHRLDKLKTIDYENRNQVELVEFKFTT